VCGRSLDIVLSLQNEIGEGAGSFYHGGKNRRGLILHCFSQMTQYVISMPPMLDKYTDDLSLSVQMFLLDLYHLLSDSVVILSRIIHILPHVEYIRLYMSHRKGKRVRGVRTRNNVGMGVEPLCGLCTQGLPFLKWLESDQLYHCKI
jgi:hypothetical protein